MPTIAVLLIGTLFSACSHTSNFMTDPAGATVFVDGLKIGKTPVEFDEKTGTRSYSLRIEKEGYESIEKFLPQDQLSTEMLIGAGGGAAACLGAGCVLGLFACWPCFWGGGLLGAGGLIYSIFVNKQLKDSYTYRMEPLARQGNVGYPRGVTGGNLQ